VTFEAPDKGVQLTTFSCLRHVGCHVRLCAEGTRAPAREMSSLFRQPAHYREADRKNQDAKNNYREYGWGQILRPRTRLRVRGGFLKQLMEKPRRIWSGPVEKVSSCPVWFLFKEKATRGLAGPPFIPKVFLRLFLNANGSL
jgi:hypothetical protein